MRPKILESLEICRVKTGPLASTKADGRNGCFVVPLAHGVELTVMCSDGGGWDHVSVSLPHRCPTWPEMCQVKSWFFEDDETVLQYHPPKDSYVNLHPYALHMWRQQGVKVTLPPGLMV